MSIIKAYAMPHPPLAVPSVGRGQEKEISKTLAALEEVAAEIASIAPETIIYITPHNVLYSDYFHISPGAAARGDLSRFGASGTKLEVQYDEELVAEISRIAEHNDIPAGTQGERDARLDHAVFVPMWYINEKYTDYKAVRVSQSGMAASEHYLMGQIISKAVELTGRKTVLIGSADLSHKLQKDGPYDFAPEGQQFDDAVTKAITDGDFLALFRIPEKTRERAAECGYNSLMMLAGCFDRLNVKTNLLSYEGPFGVGYAVASFSPVAPDEEQNILEKFVEHSIFEAKKSRESEDEYRELARRSLEHIIETGKKFPVPKGLPEEMMKTQAGVFVSLHKNGRLRGCIGTISPSTVCIAEEIIQNAISAGLSDNRFAPVEAHELDYLTYKVDVLSEAEPVSGHEELDVKRYGVIVTSGFKRGLLLPNLEGVDTVEDQIRIASSKAGISEGEPVKLERFEVIRHE